MATSAAVRPTVKLRDTRQHDELARIARTLAVREDRPITMADAIDRLLALWRSANGART
jgi:hypothetical protein